MNASATEKTQETQYLVLDRLKSKQAPMSLQELEANLTKDLALSHRNVKEAASSINEGYSTIPICKSYSKNSTYTHYTSNNTIYGTQFHKLPNCNAPLVCDASSDILSRPIDVNQHALIYAGAQKNAGIAGITLVLLRKDIRLQHEPGLPFYRYQTYIDSDSCKNTPPVFPILSAVEMFRWCREQGGLKGLEKSNQEKASLLYQRIDKNDFYRGHANKESRSLMNVTFRLTDTALEEDFLSGAYEQGFIGLRGHRSVGGIRASLYNAFPLEGVRELVAFMDDFEAQRG